MMTTRSRFRFLYRPTMLDDAYVRTLWGLGILAAVLIIALSGCFFLIAQIVRDHA